MDDDDGERDSPQQKYYGAQPYPSIPAGNQSWNNERVSPPTRVSPPQPYSYAPQQQQGQGQQGDGKNGNWQHFTNFVDSEWMFLRRMLRHACTLAVSCVLAFECHFFLIDHAFLPLCPALP